MAMLILKKIDAFSTGRSSGNPAGVVYLEKDAAISEETMQEMARRQKGIASEVAFCKPTDSGSYWLRYYSSECEVEFCGHATVACMYDLIKNNAGLLKKDVIMIENRRGELPVVNDISGSDSVFITAPAPEYLPCDLAWKEVAANLGVPESALDDNHEMSLINGGLKTLIVPIGSLNGILAIRPDQLRLAGYCKDNDLDIILVFCAEVSGSGNSYRTRVFAPKYGYLEDPATGSGNAAFGYYLLGARRCDGRIIFIEQGPSREDPNIVKLAAREFEGSRRVMFGGNALVRYEEQLDV